MTRKELEATIASAEEDFLAQLRRVNGDRAAAWLTNPLMLCEHCGASEGEQCAPPFKVQPHAFTKPHPYITRETPSDPLFWAIELGGEVGEILNVVKKLRREELGWKGSRASLDDLADEIADGVICLDSLARHYGIDLAAATATKFNKTSEKVGFPHRLDAHPQAELTKMDSVDDADVEAARVMLIDLCAPMSELARDAAAVHFAHHRIAALDRAAEVAEEFASVVDGMPRHEQPLLENSEGWRRVSDGAKDIADAILALKEPT